MDWTSGPVTMTGLVSWWSRAAFRGLTELKSTADRQPVKPREAIRDSSGSKSPESEEERRREKQSLVFYQNVKRKSSIRMEKRSLLGQIVRSDKLKSFLYLNDL